MALFFCLYNKDIHGSITNLIDKDGKSVKGYTYDDFGKAQTYGNSTVLNEMTYTGAIHDDSTDLYYMNARYYDSRTGRFLSQDSERGDPKNENTWNLYSYCANDPINYVDPSGHWSIKSAWSSAKSSAKKAWNNPTARKVMIGTAVIAGAAALTVATGGACWAAGALHGAVVGAASGAAWGGAQGAVSHRVKTGTWKGAKKAAIRGAADGYMNGAISGAIGGAKSGKFCFIAGTAVLTTTASIVIEDIRAGDTVWAAVPETGQKEPKKVVRTFQNETSELVHIKVEGEVISSTPFHKIYSPVKGWTDAVSLRAGDILVLQNGKYVIIEEVEHEILEKPVKVYNFEVEDFHTYYVGENSVLVHNRKCDNFDTWLNKGKKDYKVYRGVEGKRKTYVGITKQKLSKRLYQHRRDGKKFSSLAEKHSGLTRNQARALEQYYINDAKTNTKRNAINSIRSKHRHAKAAQKWAEEYVKRRRR